LLEEKKCELAKINCLVIVEKKNEQPKERVWTTTRKITFKKLVRRSVWTLKNIHEINKEWKML
jgi:hypothetical protein